MSAKFSEGDGNEAMIEVIGITPGLNASASVDGARVAGLKGLNPPPPMRMTRSVPAGGWGRLMRSNVSAAAESARAERQKDGDCDRCAFPHGASCTAWGKRCSGGCDLVRASKFSREGPGEKNAPAAGDNVLLAV